jgi:hypothetical protein
MMARMPHCAEPKDRSWSMLCQQGGVAIGMLPENFSEA